MNTRSKKTWLAVLVAGLLVFPLLVSSCAQEPDSSTLEGYWLSDKSDGFEVSGKNFAQFFIDTNNSKQITFTGTIVGEPDITAESGILIIKIVTTSTYGPTVGLYYGISWKNLKGNGVSESAAYKTGGSKNSGVATIDEAMAEYSVANDYYGFYSDCNRQ